MAKVKLEFLVMEGEVVKMMECLTKEVGVVAVTFHEEIR